jgi:hypothetical protein
MALLETRPHVKSLGFGLLERVDLLFYCPVWVAKGPTTEAKSKCGTTETHSTCSKRADSQIIETATYMGV